ncbi:MAG: integrin [Planctomycetes bacterium]|nr:integrin [Planctomycetota bacterium]
MKNSNLLTIATVLLTLAACGGGGGGGSASSALSTNADLADLSISAGTLDPPFSSDTYAYLVGPQEMFVHGSVTLTPLAAHAGATITVDGLVVASGTPSSVIDVPATVTPVLVRVTAEDGESVREYNVIITRQGLSMQTDYVKASNTGGNDRFGYSVALDGDTLVVGADYEASNATGVDGDQLDHSAPHSGAVYVFFRHLNGTWFQEAYLKASNTGAGDAFGQSVALDGDTLVVGADGEDSNATGVNGNQLDNSAPWSGAAYVFVRSDGIWSQQAYLKASNTDSDDAFGQSVALDGDTLVVGANEASNATGVNGNALDNSASSSGAAYVFFRSGGTWSQQAYLKASNTDASDFFGWSVALDGDTVVVGADSESSNATGVNGNQLDNSADSSGAAYVFVRSDGIWSQQAYLKASNTESNDTFGTSVALDGDTLMVGADGEDSNATGVNGNQLDNSSNRSGAAYVFVRSDGTWSQQAYLKASNTGAGDVFGRSLALDGDTLVVGASSEDGGTLLNNLPESGAAYVFVRSGGIWSQENYVKALDTESADGFGVSVALDGGTLLVGAWGEDSNATGVNGNQFDNSASFSGAAYLFK